MKLLQMKYYLITLLFFCVSNIAFAQLNPFAKNTLDYRVYEHYLTARNKDWLAFKDNILPIADSDKRKLKPAATEIIYNMAYSILAFLLEENATKAEVHLNKCDEWLAKYEVRKAAYWNDDDYVLWEGMKYFYTAPLENWRPSVKNKGISAINQNFGLPEFPFPPPQASSSEVLPKSFFNNCKNLGDIDKKLNLVLSKSGYERSYFKVPGGFALVSRLEQIKDDASAMQDPNRWSDQIPPVNSFSEYMSALFFPRIGYFRIVVFIITDVSFSQKREVATKQEAMTWLKQGNNILPEDAAKLPLNPNFNCTALIYEYQFTENQKSKLSNRFSAQAHLEKANLWNNLK